MCVTERERDRDRESDPITSLQAESGSPPCGGNVYMACCSSHCSSISHSRHSGSTVPAGQPYCAS